MPNTPLVKLVNKETGEEKFYLEYKAEKVQSVEYFTETGEPLTKEQVQEFLPKKSTSSTQRELTKKIILRDVQIENILSLRISKKVFLG